MAKGMNKLSQTLMQSSIYVFWDSRATRKSALISTGVAPRNTASTQALLSVEVDRQVSVRPPFPKTKEKLKRKTPLGKKWNYLEEAKMRGFIAGDRSAMEPAPGELKSHLDD